eukprot:gb/GECG01005154.1/.p1 GENE.gb/GECG01005154.1/~~gb/GECG01005154.1/.p1  ORF type:complete len:287 (+),score=26.78 gb/GECG01005154.1/:1-861(+)
MDQSTYARASPTHCTENESSPNVTFTSSTTPSIPAGYPEAYTRHTQADTPHEGVSVLVHNVSHSDFFVSLEACQGEGGGSCRRDRGSDRNAARAPESNIKSLRKRRRVVDEISGSSNSREFVPSSKEQATQTDQVGEEISRDERQVRQDEEIQPQPFARPKFSAFDPVSAAVLQFLKETHCPNYPMEVIMHPSEVVGMNYPIGLSLPDRLVFPAWDDFKLRDPRVCISGPKPALTGAIFPLISIILPKWHHLLTEGGISGKKSANPIEWIRYSSKSGTPYGRQQYN